MQIPLPFSAFPAVLASQLRLLVLAAALACTALAGAAQQAGGDTEIAERIRAFLVELDGYEEVDVTVRSGIVTLTGEVVDPLALDRLLALVEQVEGVAAVENEVVESTDLSKRIDPVLQRLQDRLVLALANLPLLLVALVAGGLVALAGFLLARWDRPFDRLAPNAFIAEIYRQILRLAFLVGGIVVALEFLNATALLSTILAAGGILGLALGFAVRDTVENFIASIMMSIRQPFAPNDVVEINGDTGKVIRLTSRATILLSFDGNHIRLPNSTVYKSRIVNYTRNPERRFTFLITVAADSDLAQARDVMEQTVNALPYTLEVPGVSAWIEGITNAGIEFTVAGWIDQTQTSLVRARGEALRLVKAALEGAGFTLPDTTYRVVLDGAPPAPGEAKPPAPREATVPPPAEVPGPQAVTTQDDQALDRMIDAERADEAAPDLLRNEAPKE
jgi:small-conductance mechanosensitive channel